MKKSLNIENIKSAKTRKGINNSRIASELSISKSDVMKWLRNEEFPEFKLLYRFGRLLALPYSDLVIERRTKKDPQFAYRAKRNRKTKDEHLEKAKFLAKCLEGLNKTVPMESFSERKTPEPPQYNYQYIQKLVLKIRKELGLEPTDTIGFEDIVKKMVDFKAILIPVFWGDKKHHGNALSIYIPRNNTTWVFLNIDAKVHDFKFWMSHELAHLLNSFDNTKAGEDFSDLFAQALLFPEPCAEVVYKKLRRLRNHQAICNEIFDIAIDHLISPYTVLRSIDAYAKENGLKEIEVAKNLFHGRLTNFGKEIPTIIEMLMDDEIPTASDYIEIANNQFQSPFFDIISDYIYLSGKRSAQGVLQNLLDLAFFDAKAIDLELRR